MPEKTIAQKLIVKPGQKLLLVHAPHGYQQRMQLPAGTRVIGDKHGPADVIQVFVAGREELERELPRLKRLLAPGGALWVSYRKGATRANVDINRDSIREYAQGLGLQAVAMIAVDEEWSALRLKAV